MKNVNIRDVDKNEPCGLWDGDGVMRINHVGGVGWQNMGMGGDKIKLHEDGIGIEKYYGDGAGMRILMLCHYLVRVL